MFSKIRVELKHNVSFRIVTAIVTFLFVCSVTVTAFAASAGIMKVTVADGSRVIEIATRSDDPEEIVTEAGLKLAANDELDLSAFDAEEGGTIKVLRAKTLRVVDENDVMYCIGYSTVGNTLKSSGVALNEMDETSISLEENLSSGMQVVIKRAFKVTVEADGEQTEVYTTGATVEEVLEKAGVDISDDDKISHKSTTPLIGEAVITVGRVEYKERVETESYSYETVTKTTDELYEGESEVVTKGVDGIKEVTYSDKYVDGEFMSTEAVDEEIVKEAVDEVVKIGSKKRPALVEFKDGVVPISDLATPSYVELDDNRLPIDYVDYYEGESTAYTGDPATASGRKPCQGHVAVDPKKFPYGTELYIVSLDGNYIYGYCIAADTGGFVNNSNTMVDLYLDTEDMCYEWGRRDVAIYVISYPD